MTSLPDPNGPNHETRSKSSGGFWHCALKMRLLSFGTAAEFGESASGWLSADERQNNVIISRLVSAERHPAAVRGWVRQ